MTSAQIGLNDAETRMPFIFLDKAQGVDHAKRYAKGRSRHRESAELRAGGKEKKSQSSVRVACGHRKWPNLQGAVQGTFVRCTGTTPTKGPWHKVFFAEGHDLAVQCTLRGH